MYSVPGVKSEISQVRNFAWHRTLPNLLSNSVDNAIVPAQHLNICSGKLG